MNEQERAFKFIEALQNLQEEWGFYVVVDSVGDLVAKDYMTDNTYEIEQLSAQKARGGAEE